MDRRVGAALTAFVIFFVTVWFPVLAVYAENAETEIIETPEHEVATPANTNSTSALAAPEQETQGGNVNSFEDLQILLDESGTVKLGANITIPRGESIDLSGKSVHTAEFGIIVEGELELGSGTAIAGDGVLQPVIEVLSGGSLYIAYSDFDDAPYIEATGGGGRALALREGGEYGQTQCLPSFLRVTASGANGIALESKIALDLKRHFIEAENGIGIVCDKEVKLFLCQISADTASVQAPVLIADTCVLSLHASEDFTEISRKITKLESDRDCVALGDSLPDYINSSDYRGPFTATLHAEGYDDVVEEIHITMDSPDIDTSVTGLYPVRINTEDWLRAFDLVPEGAELYHIEVYDPRIPLYKSTFSSYWGTYDVCYWYRGEDLTGLTLWRSDDEGENWYDYTTAADIELNSYREELILSFLEIPEHPIWFVWEAEGIGESQILRVTWDEADDYGGDRIGDRGENELPPMLIRPPAPPDNPDGETPTVPPTDPGGEAPVIPPTDPGGETPTVPSTDPGGETPTVPPTDSGGGTTTKPGGRTSTASPMGTEPTDKTPESNYGGVNIPSENAQQAVAAVEMQTQTAPVPAPTSVTPAEYSDETSVTMSGARLAVMMEANPEYVSFMRGELRVSLPTAFLKSLNMNDSDAFTVELTMPEERLFSVFFAVNQQELTQRFDEPFIVGLPWNGNPISCVSESGEKANAALDGDRASFPLHHAGVYALTEQDDEIIANTNTTPAQSADTTPPTEPAPESPKPYFDSIVPVVVVGAVSLAGAGAYLGFLRKRLVTQS